MKVATPQASSRLWPIEKTFIVYAGLNVCLLAFALRHDWFPVLLMVAYAALIGLLIVLAKSSSPKLLFLRHWYLLIYVPFCYKQVPYLVSALQRGSADHVLAGWDLAMWKVDPVFWLSSMPNRFAVEFLQMIYTMFLPGTLALGIVLWVRKSREEFRYGTFLIAETFLISYVGYLLMPARGPRFMQYASLHSPLQGLWMFHFLQGTLDKLEGLQYDCFPSGHVAVVLVGCYLARRISGPVFYTFSVFAALITFSTIYLRYHYVIDVIAGMVLAGVVIEISPALYRRLEGTKPGDIV